MGVRVQQVDEDTWTVWLGTVRLTSFPSKTGAEECADKIRSFAALPQAVEGWKPIKTAPKDGTLVVLHRHGDNPEVGGWIACKAAAGGGFWTGLNRPVRWTPLPSLPDPVEGGKP